MKKLLLAACIFFVCSIGWGQTIADLTCMVSGKKIKYGNYEDISLTEVPVSVEKVPSHKNKLAIYVGGTMTTWTKAEAWDMDVKSTSGELESKYSGVDKSNANYYEVEQTGEHFPNKPSSVAKIRLNRKTGELFVSSEYAGISTNFSGTCEKKPTKNKF